MPEYLAEARKLASVGAIPVVLISRDPGRSEATADRELQWQKWQRDLCRVSSSSRSVVAKGSGHDIPSERPDLIVKAVRDLLTQIRGPG